MKNLTKILEDINNKFSELNIPLNINSLNDNILPYILDLTDRCDNTFKLLFNDIKLIISIKVNNDENILKIQFYFVYKHTSGGSNSDSMFLSYDLINYKWIY